MSGHHRRRATQRSPTTPISPKGGAGWRGYDPSQGLVVADRHVAVAAGRIPVQTQPVAGSYRGAVSSTMKVEIQIEAGKVSAAE